jgi:hypothetical protein
MHAASQKRPQARQKKPRPRMFYFIVLFSFEYLHTSKEIQSGGSRKSRKGQFVFFLLAAVSLLMSVPVPFKADHPVAAQYASTSGLKKLLRKRASDKVKKAKKSAPTQHSDRRKGRVNALRRMFY